MWVQSKQFCQSFHHQMSFARCSNKTIIRHPSGVTACTADGKSAWSQVSRLLWSFLCTAWQVLAAQRYRWIIDVKEASSRYWRFLSDRTVALAQKQRSWSSSLRFGFAAFYWYRPALCTLQLSLENPPTHSFPAGCWSYCEHLRCWMNPHNDASSHRDMQRWRESKLL